MTFKSLVKTLLERGDSRLYGAGPAGFKRLMKRLGNPQNAYQIIHVAGTNGKGSVCYLCAEVLKAAGYKTGLFISPHLHSPTERIQLNGRAISQTDFVRCCQQVVKAEEEKLNFFEILTAAAFLYFAQKHADWVVLETGLGGRRDPTNVCRPAACIISSIGLDHCHVLGNTLAHIAYEKAGIIKKNIPVFCPPLPRQAMLSIKQISQQKQAPLYLVKQNAPFELSRIDWDNSDLILRRGSEHWSLHLLGEKQVQNACLVYQVCRFLKVPEKLIKQGFAQVNIPGRFEIIRRGRKTIILDGAHNPQAIENLIKFWQKSPWADKTAVVCGFMADKDYPGMLRMLAKQNFPLYICPLFNLRAATVAEIKNALPQAAQVKYMGEPAQAIKQALDAYPVVLVTGSFYLMSAIGKTL